MSLPVSNEPRDDGGRWGTIRYALDSNARTLRLCLIWAVAIVSPVAATLITMLLRHMVLRGPGAGLGQRDARQHEPVAVVVGVQPLPRGDRVEHRPELARDVLGRRVAVIGTCSAWPTESLSAAAWDTRSWPA